MLKMPHNSSMGCDSRWEFRSKERYVEDSLSIVVVVSRDPNVIYRNQRSIRAFPHRRSLPNRLSETAAPILPRSNCRAKNMKQTQAQILRSSFGNWKLADSKTKEGHHNIPFESASSLPLASIEPWDHSDAYPHSCEWERKHRVLCYFHHQGPARFP